MTRAYKRRRYFIDRPLQTKYLLLTILLLLVYTALFSLILFLPPILSLAGDATIADQANAARTLLTLHTHVWPALGVVILVMAVVSIFVTHRMAGPVYRFKQVLGEISGGNLEVAVQLRRKDDLQDLAEVFNGVVEELREFVATLRAEHANMDGCIRELEEQLREHRIASEAGGELLENLKAGRAEIARVLEKYAAGPSR